MNKFWPKTPLLVIAIAASLIGNNAFAQKSARRPGLWEIKSKTWLDGKVRTATMGIDTATPEMRKQIDSQTASRGFKIVNDTPEGRTVNLCVSQAQALKEPEVMTAAMRKRGCDAVLIGKKPDGASMYEFTCAGNVSGAGRGEMKLISPERYEGFTEVNNKGALQGPQLVRNEIKARSSHLAATKGYRQKSLLIFRGCS
jgi:Protein of unknown function (DUF3617)